MSTATELAALRDYATHEHPVVTLYLNVNGVRYPRKGDYETEYSFMVHEARRAANEDLGLSRDQEDRLDAQLQAIGEFLALEFRREGARGLIVFSCRDEDLWQVMPLKLPVENRLLVDWKPRLAPLAELLDRHRHFCVLVTNKETARLFEQDAGEFSERSDVFDTVLKHHAQGGWEQAKLQRRHELQVRNHLKKAADAAMDYCQTRSAERLAVGVAEELWPELEKVLHPYLRERLAGRFSVDITAGVNEIHDRVSAIEADLLAAEETTILESLAAELAAGKTYIGGLDDVLAALNERRVDLLLTEDGFSGPGRICNSCGTVAFGEEVCPGCQLDMQPIADIVSEARELAVRQDARIITVPPGHPAMSQAGGIAAHLRY